MSRRAHADGDGEPHRYQYGPERELRGIAERVTDQRLDRLVGALARAPIAGHEAAHLVGVLDHQGAVEAEVLADPAQAGEVAAGAAADASGIGPELAHQQEDEDRRE